MVTSLTLSTDLFNLLESLTGAETPRSLRNLFKDYPIENDDPYRMIIPIEGLYIKIERVMPAIRNKSEAISPLAESHLFASGRILLTTRKEDYHEFV